MLPLHCQELIDQKGWRNQGGELQAAPRTF